jgi:hypothetical protein
MDFERAEAAAEGNVRFGCDALVAEDQHMVIQMRAVEAREVGGVDGLADVQAEHLGADRRIEAADLEVLGWRGVRGGSHSNDPSASRPL